MEQIMQGAATGRPVTHNPIYFNGRYPTVIPQPRTDEHRLVSLKVTSLSYHYDSEGEKNGGISDVSFTLHEGSFTVITGRVGSGKSTLLKALLGLLPMQKGEIYWNDKLVTDPAAFFVPPRCAYTGQVPRLLSDSLRSNILMGLPESDFNLDQAVKTAVLERDIDTMENKLDTMVGPRGVRLSGGQIQRTAAARMFVRKASLLVFDDLSSALDIETEYQLWNNVFSGQGQFDHPVTCLVVSHRKPVLQKADQVILLNNGKIECVGTLKELLARSDEMKKIWYGNDSIVPPG
jgi:ATP-binding cassette subfamily B protein